MIFSKISSGGTCPQTPLIMLGHRKNNRFYLGAQPPQKYGAPFVKGCTNKCSTLFNCHLFKHLEGNSSKYQGCKSLLSSRYDITSIHWTTIRYSPIFKICCDTIQIRYDSGACDRYKTKCPFNTSTTCYIPINSQKTTSL